MNKTKLESNISPKHTLQTLDQTQRHEKIEMQLPQVYDWPVESNIALATKKVVSGFLATHPSGCSALAARWSQLTAAHRDQSHNKVLAEKGQ